MKKINRVGLFKILIRLSGNSGIADTNLEHLCTRQWNSL
jgi:hypothetical protein